MFSSCFWILVPLFVAVGLYLIWYSRRRKKMLEAFAKNHQLRIRPEYTKELQKRLDSCFPLEDRGVVRSFGQLSSPVGGEPVWLFLAIELLDLNPHAQSYSTHHPRIVAVFDIPADLDEFFVLDNSMQKHRRLPGSKLPDPHVAEILRRAAALCRTRYPLSVTLRRGLGLIYFEPVVTGGETIREVDALYCIAGILYEKLSGGV